MAKRTPWPFASMGHNIISLRNNSRCNALVEDVIMKLIICIASCKQLAVFMFALMLFVCPLCSYAQNSNFNFDSAFERTAQLIVMLKADYGETQEFGAGIVFGREKDRLLIATAYHI